MACYAELEHFYGYGGKHLNTVRYHPLQTETLIYAAAAAIIIEDVSDPHKQEFLRGHDAEVTCIDVSQNGKLVASGQLGSLSQKGAVAPVVVWDFDNRQRYIEFSGLSHSVLVVKFSPDGRFLCATGADQQIFIWDVSTGETVYHRRTESPCFFAAWGAILEPQRGSRYPSYQLVVTMDSQVLSHTMSFDIKTMSYTLSTEPMQFPPSGLQRKYLCGIVRGDFLITGTAAGDMCVFSIKNCVFRSALPVCNNGVTSITPCGDFLYVAGGDGRIKAIKGNDTHWDVLAENTLEVGIMSLTSSADGAELIAATRNGKMWRLLSSDLTATLQSASHTGEVTDISFGPSSDQVCSVSDSGEVCLTDLSDYMPLCSATFKSSARCSVMCESGNEMIVGYDDGHIRCWSTTRRAGQQDMLWQLAAHRGKVTCVREGPLYIVTGGEDCAVRFWHRTTREQLTSFTNHRRPPADILLDAALPNIVHSAAEDKLVVTYDLKTNKPMIQHFTQHSMITSLSQRKDREQEVVSCSLDGKILFWDVDYPDPTGALECPGGHPIRLRCCEVSPSGRYIAAGADDSRLYLYDLATCSCIQECDGHVGGINQVRWSPDQKQIVTGGKDGCIIVWNFFEL